MTNYTLSVVDRAGVPVVVASFGSDLAMAIQRMETHHAEEMARQAARGTFVQQVWMIHDADDPERGYFHDVEDAREFGGTQ